MCHQMLKMGTSVLESKYDAIIAKPTASESGKNNAFAAPVMKKLGTKTARMQSMESERGPMVSSEASRTIRRRFCLVLGAESGIR